MTASQTQTLTLLLSLLSSVRGKDFSQAPIDEKAVGPKGKFNGKPVALVALSLVDASFPDVVISERGGLDIPLVSSYPESKTGTCRYDANLPATAISAAVYGDKHLGRVGYGRMPQASQPQVNPIPANVAIDQAKALQTV